jgi:hypothetical protein
MKIEKKIIAICAFALAIGIAAILPMTPFMIAEAQTDADPWFNVDPFFAYFRVDQIDGGYRVTDMVNFQHSLNDNALNQKSDARIEYFEFTFYTEYQQLLKHTVWISMSKDNYKDSTINEKSEFPRTSLPIIHENLLNSTYLNTDYMSGIDADLFNDAIEWSYVRGTGNTFGTKDSKFNAVLEAQAVYLDVSRVCYVTINGDTTKITWTNNQDIQHFELTKNNGAFTFGTPDNLDVHTGFDAWAQNAPVDLSNTTLDDFYADLETRTGIKDPR